MVPSGSVRAMPSSARAARLACRRSWSRPGPAAAARSSGRRQAEHGQQLGQAERAQVEGAQGGGQRRRRARPAGELGNDAGAGGPADLAGAPAAVAARRRRGRKGRPRNPAAVLLGTGVEDWRLAPQRGEPEPPRSSDFPGLVMHPVHSPKQPACALGVCGDRGQPFHASRVGVRAAEDARPPGRRVATNGWPGG